MRQYTLTALVVIVSYAIGYNIGLHKQLHTEGDAISLKDTSSRDKHKQVDDRTRISHHDLSKPLSHVQSDKIKELSALLNDKTKSLKLLQAEIEKLQIPAKRFNYLMKNYKKYGSSFVEIPELREDFKPAPSMVEFFGLDDEAFNAIKLAGEKALTQVKDWELINAQLIVNEETLTVYDMPAGDDILFGIKTAFTDELIGGLGNENMLFVTTMVNNVFKEFSRRREFRYSTVGEKTDSRWGGGTLKFQMLRYNDNGKEAGRGSSTLPERYSHLFR